MIYFLGLGSNLGDSVNNLKRAVEKLNEVGVVKKKSSLYKTGPVGNRNQNDFFNAVLEFEFDESPVVLLEKVKKIEIEIGRKKTYRWGPREIDIDIIDSIGTIFENSKLNIPHTEMEKRNFVLIPLCEIYPDYKNRKGKSIQDLISNKVDDTYVDLFSKAW